MFKAVIAKEGSSPPGMKITIPQPVLRVLAETGIKPPCWIKLHVVGYAPIFAFLRRAPSRTSVDLCLPRWHFSTLAFGVEIEVAIEDAIPYRARGDAAAFDWLPYVDESRYFPTTEGNLLALQSRYEAPFFLQRSTPLEATYWLLGFYQAEGSKSQGAPDFMLANTNAALLRKTADTLALWGINHTRQYIEVLHAPGESAKQAEATYASIGLRVAATRCRTGKGGHAAVLHVSKSQVLQRLICAVLDRIDFPTPEAARAYAIGWLDGDGTITVMDNAVEMRLAGLIHEHEIMSKAFAAGFSWSPKSWRYAGSKQGTHITLRADEMLDLLDSSAFAFSMSHVRLLLGFDERVRRLHEVHAGTHNGAGGYRRWGLVDGDGFLTKKGEALLDGHKRWAQKINEARRLEATSPHLFGVKGVPNPL
jgi:hypothetical protein